MVTVSSNVIINITALFDIFAIFEEITSKTITKTIQNMLTEWPAFDITTNSIRLTLNYIKCCILDSTQDPHNGFTTEWIYYSWCT